MFYIKVIDKDYNEKFQCTRMENISRFSVDVKTHPYAFYWNIDRKCKECLFSAFCSNLDFFEYQ